jgi:hypothetical protein
MPSSMHQWLLLWIARKMIADGYAIGGYDGVSPQGGPLNQLPPPFVVGGRRPDVWGEDRLRQHIAFGEAKTSAGLRATYARRQLSAFCSARDRRTGRLCAIYLGVPRSAAGLLDALLADLRMGSAPHVRRICIPDCLLESDLQ